MRKLHATLIATNGKPQWLKKFRHWRKKINGRFSTRLKWSKDCLSANGSSKQSRKQERRMNNVRPTWWQRGFRNDDGSTSTRRMHQSQNFLRYASCCLMPTHTDLLWVKWIWKSVSQRQTWWGNIHAPTRRLVTNRCPNYVCKLDRMLQYMA